MKWDEYPFLLLTPALIIGILLNSFFRLPGNDYLIAALLILTFLAIYFVSFKIKKTSRGLLISTLSIIGFIFVGYASSQLTFQTDRPEVTQATLGDCDYYTAIIDSKPDKTPKSTRYEIIIKNIRTGDGWTKLGSKALLYVSGDTSLSYGDVILIKGRPQLLENQKNPHAFDYSLFLQRKGIFLQSFCNADNLVLVDKRPWEMPYITLHIGDFFEEILSRYIRSARELNMAKAMVIGRRNEVTPEMEYVYEATGTSHILAVSGLHVGIIFLLVSSVFKFMKKTRHKWLYYAIVLFAIWAFALITGLSPSVKRAGLMLSFILIAEMINRKSNIYNTILSSAFCILFFSPNLIFSVSFQFSYAAVLGIIYLYKKLYALIFIKTRFLDFFWKITVLSFAVQIATFPINVYYFHQFPALFPVTNLFAIPTATAVIVGSLGIFITSALPFLPDILGKLLQGWIYVYNDIMQFLSNLSFTSIEDLTLKAPYVFLIMILVFLFIRFIETRKMALFRWFTVLFCILSVMVFYDFYDKSRQTRVVVYSVENRLFMDVFIGRTCYTNINTQNEKSLFEMIFNVFPNREYHLISEVRNLNLMDNAKKIGKNTLLILNGRRMLVFDDPFDLSSQVENVELDYLIIGRKSIPHLNFIAHSLRFKNLILDGTIHSADIDAIKNHLKAPAIHSILQAGVLSISI
jgi:competence protein ComEC